MVSRKDLARSHAVEETHAEEETPEVSNDTFTERKAAFGDKRDDLFYKTIGRDVRKYLQEQFQVFLGEKTLKECIRNGTFLKEVKSFFQKQISTEVPLDVDSEKVLCCVATLISYQGYAPYCLEENKDFSLKIHDSLHNFTKVKLINMCKLREFQEVFKHYAKRISVNKFERFTSHRTMKTNVRGYKYAFSDILKQ